MTTKQDNTFQDDNTQDNDSLPLELWGRDRLLVSLTGWGFDFPLTATDDELRNLVRQRSVDRLLGEALGPPSEYEEVPDIRRTLVLSTCHIAQLDAEKGDRVDHQGCLNKLDYGFSLYVGSQSKGSREHVSAQLREHYSTDFEPILKMAWNNDCTYIEFDSDGPEMETLARYEW